MIPTHTLRSTVLTAVLAGSLCLPLLGEEPPAGYVDLGKFIPPSGGGQFVEVNVQGDLLNLAARLTEKQEPEVADLLRGLKSVRVNVVGIDKTNREDITERARSLREELESKGWNRLVTVQDKGQDVAVYLKHRGEEAIEGVVVTVVDGKKEAVFINIVGDIRPEKIAVLGERLHIEPLKKIGATINKS